MNLRTINLVIAREYTTRVKKKSFLILTFVVPVLFALLATLPTIIMLNTKEKTQQVAVVDNSGIVMPYLESGESAVYTDYTGTDVDSLKSGLQGLGLDVLVLISPLDSAASVSVQTYSNKPAGVDFAEALRSKVKKAVEDYRISTYNIPGLDKIMKDVKADIKVKEYTLGEDGKETVSESGIYMMVSMILGMIIYMFIAIFGGMVLSSVIEEKSSKVIEVIVSSVKAIDLMFGKIIGIALVALTQFLLWIIFTGILLAAGSAIFGFGDKIKAADPAQASQMMQMASPAMAGMEGTIDLESIAQAEPDELSVVLTTLANIPWGKMLISFLVFFILGYLLYASMFAAIGSAVENEADSTQLQLPITIPLIIGFFIAFIAMRNPYSGIVWWGSMIPFTSPIVMLARIPYDVPTWEILLSAGILLLTFAGIAWASAKIYKAGILIFGQKSTWKDLWKWLKQK